MWTSAAHTNLKEWVLASARMTIKKLPKRDPELWGLLINLRTA
jgi:hypothetical protein